MSRYAAIAEQLLRAGSILRDYELAKKRVDDARLKLGTENPLSQLADELVTNVDFSSLEKYHDIFQRINSWLAVEITTINRAAAIIEKINK